MYGAPSTTVKSNSRRHVSSPQNKPFSSSGGRRPVTTGLDFERSIDGGTIVSCLLATERRPADNPGGGRGRPGHAVKNPHHIGGTAPHRLHRRHIQRDTAPSGFDDAALFVLQTTSLKTLVFLCRRLTGTIKKMWRLLLDQSRAPKDPWCQGLILTYL